MSPFFFDGKTYSSPDEMPPEVRRAYEQALNVFADGNRDGAPDVLQGVGGEGNIHLQSVSISSNKAQVVIDGKVYSSVEEMPAQVRQDYEQAVARVAQVFRDADQDGVPDVLEGILASPPGHSESTAVPKARASAMPSKQESITSVAQEWAARLWLPLLIATAIALVVGVVGTLLVWTFGR